MTRLIAPWIVRCCAAGVVALVAPGAAHALFKVVAPDGSVTYTDRPPSSDQGRVQAVSRDTGRATDPQLPYALRQVASRFPVVLYTAAQCAQACNLGRAHLLRRGIPYSERTALTDEEREAWTRLVGGSEAPTLMVGSQSLRGYVPAAWDEALSVAGYPANSLLPATWQPPAPVPLIAPRAAAPAAPALPAAPSLPASPDDDSGVRF
ncbi:MAG TPA: glutaredoxin family protein [Burkholderiaceae bacterium]|nr:glutaredoxin family protein [Burkholderiaceae bacterium]